MSVCRKKTSADMSRLGCFKALTPEVLVDMIEAIEGGTSKFEDLPSYEAAMSGKLRFELMSLHIVSNEDQQANQLLSVEEANLLEANANGVPLGEGEADPDQLRGWRNRLRPSCLDMARNQKRRRLNRTVFD